MARQKSQFHIGQSQRRRSDKVSGPALSPTPSQSTVETPGEEAAASIAAGQEFINMMEMLEVNRDALTRGAEKGAEEAASAAAPKPGRQGQIVNSHARGCPRRLGHQAAAPRPV